MGRSCIIVLIGLAACAAAPDHGGPGSGAPAPVVAAPVVAAPTDAAQAPTPTQADAIRERFGQRCHFERACGALWGIDCESAVDGPYFYVKQGTLESVAECGGYCMGGHCTNCPPAEWKCPTY